MSPIDEFYEKTACLVRGKDKDMIKSILDLFVEEYGDDCLKVYNENPFILVTKFNLAFEATRFKQGLYTMTKSRIKITTFKMHLNAMYALIYDLLRINESKGNSCQHIHDLWIKVRHFYSWMTTSELRCYLYYYKDEFMYDINTESVGFLNKYRQERFIFAKIHSMLAIDSNVPEVTTYIDNKDLIDEQNDAVKTVFKSRVSVLTGGPGTGKTTVIRTILSHYKRLNPDAAIKLLAPTGKASRRLKETITGYGDTSTIAALTFSMEKRGKEENAETIDLCIIDEASMVDSETLYDLLRYFNIRQLILVGDIDQLPSVGCGNVLKDIMGMGAITARLMVNHRNDGNILMNANKVKNKDTSVVFDDTFKLIEAKDQDIPKIATALRIDKNTMILAPYCNMSRNMNIDIHNKIYHDEAGANEYHVGDRVMFLKNRRRHGYMNGDMGTIIRFEEDDIIIELDDRDNTEIAIGPKNMDEITLGYAMTIHKSQGSEYDNVVICIPEGTGLIFSRKLLYTAITRAKHHVIIVGSKKELLRIITSENEDIRHTYISDITNQGIIELPIKAAA